MSDVQRAISQIALFWAKFASLFAPLLSAVLFARLHFLCNFPRPSGEMGGALRNAFILAGGYDNWGLSGFAQICWKKKGRWFGGSGIKFASGDLNLFRCQPRPDREHLNKGGGLKNFGCSPRQNERNMAYHFTLYFANCTGEVSKWQRSTWML